MTSKIRINLLANYLGQGWSALMSLAFVPAYIGLLGMEAFGLIGFFTMLRTWLVVVDMGMGPTLNREMAQLGSGIQSAEEIRDLLRSVEFLVLALAGAITILSIFCSSWIARSWLNLEALQHETIVTAIVAMGVVLALRLVEGIYRSALVGLQLQVRYNIISAVMATLGSLGAVLVLKFVAPTIVAFFYWQAGVALLSVASLAAATYASLPAGNRTARFSLAALAKIYRFALGMLAISILSVLLMQVDKVLLSTLLPLSEFGNYTFAAATAAVVFLALSPIMTTWFPRFSQLVAAQDHQAFACAFHSSAQLVTATVGALSMVLVFFAEPILAAWTQDSDLARQVAPLVCLLVLGNLFNALMNAPYFAQLAVGWTSLARNVNILSLLFLIPAIVFLVPQYGSIAAAGIWATLGFVSILVWPHFMFRRILSAEKKRWYISDLTIPLSAMLVAVFSISCLATGSNSSSLQLTFALVAFCIAILSAVAVSPQLRARCFSLARCSTAN